jgi:hypothetical protein
VNRLGIFKLLLRYCIFLLQLNSYYLLFCLTLQTDLSLLYATKVWAWNESSSTEPYTGTTLQGRELYWTQAVKEFENLAKLNPSLLFASTEKIKVEEDYRSTFGLVLKSRHNDGATANGSAATNGETESENKGYEPFRQFLATQVSDFKDNERGYLASIRTFSR